ncbi:sensor histidine kinase [Winogradskyella luteola]|uniref:Sensor histidine kinase n=1 Tax=Winogradskyella luteola TaxID=2828330 RepID=A0A9X1JS29_9FLAO|nr:sensor histidine kinase [Winogradskyella luteola]MBV7270503.1 sensor histidine kinase [Winogradskyella luteola]
MFYICLSIYNTLQKSISDEEIALLAYVAFFLFTIVVVFVIFFLTFQKRKNQLLIDKLKQQQRFEEELSDAQQEIQEETLKHVGRELHDNVGQLLSFATMQMNAAGKLVEDDVKSKVNNASDALKESLSEVRALSKSLNSDVIFNLGFDATVKNEIDRLNKSGLIEAKFIVRGEKLNFENKKDEIILFRILQEFISNTIKYANAENLSVTIDYDKEFLKIKIEDDGIGFDIAEAELGSGMTNMKKRAELINADFQLVSQPESGTILSLAYPYRMD